MVNIVSPNIEDRGAAIALERKSKWEQVCVSAILNCFVAISLGEYRVFHNSTN